MGQAGQAQAGGLGGECARGHVGEVGGLDLAVGQFHPGLAGMSALELKGGAFAVGQERVLVEDDVEGQL